jgi:hypothetical protein
VIKIATENGTVRYGTVRYATVLFKIIIYLKQFIFFNLNYLKFFLIFKYKIIFDFEDLSLNKIINQISVDIDNGEPVIERFTSEDNNNNVP